MDDRILARLADPSGDCVQWLQLGTPNAYEPEQVNLQDLATSAKNSPVTLLLPAADVLLLVVDLPVKSASQIHKALPFALEDLLADDVETYHLTWHRPVKDKVYVAAISHVRMMVLLSLFDEVGIKLTAIYPEALCLPYQDNCCSVLIDKDNAILRSGKWLGGGLDVNDLAVWANKQATELPHIESLQIWGDELVTQALGEVPIKLVHNPSNHPLLILQAGASSLNGEFNLLSGRFRRNNSDEWQWQKWLPALGIFLLAALLQTGSLLNSYWSQQVELAALETQSLALFKQTFPDVKRIVNIKVQAEQQLADLVKQGIGTGSRFMRLLYESGVALTANPGFQLQQLDFVNDQLKLKLTAPDISQLEGLTHQLQTACPCSVKILSAETSQNAVEALLEISEK